MFIHIREVLSDKFYLKKFTTLNPSIGFDVLPVDKDNKTTASKFFMKGGDKHDRIRGRARNVGTHEYQNLRRLQKTKRNPEKVAERVSTP